jgi:hypothetical protein
MPIEKEVDPSGSALPLVARRALAECNLAQPEPQAFGQSAGAQAGTTVRNRPLRLFYSH